MKYVVSVHIYRIPGILDPEAIVIERVINQTFDCKVDKVRVGRTQDFTITSESCDEAKKYINDLMQNGGKNTFIILKLRAIKFIL